MLHEENTALFAFETQFYLEFVWTWHAQFYDTFTHEIDPPWPLFSYHEAFISPCSMNEINSGFAAHDSVPVAIAFCGLSGGKDD